MADIQVSRIMEDLRALSAFGPSPGGGMARTTYSDDYRRAVDWLTGRCREAGMAVREDAAGNVIARLGPPEGPAVVTGSHIDSVPGGGIYDGALGVLAGVECARCLAGRAEPLPAAFEVIAFADEEGAYISLLGSRAMAGDLPHGEVETAQGRHGETLAGAMARYGLDPAALDTARRPDDAVAAYVELHIEQGPVLEAGGHRIGVVTGIVGLHNSELSFRGQANHAGTTPMHLRRDALRAAAETVSACFAAIEQDFPADTRLTFGQVAVDPGASNVVPGEVRLSQDLRALDQSDIERAAAMIRATAERVAGGCGVEATSTLKSFNRPAAMSAGVVGAIGAAAADLGIEPLSMPSGAGHDAQMMAARWRTGMIFVPSKGGISHNAAEETSVEDIETGARVLLRTVERLLSRRGTPGAGTG